MAKPMANLWFLFFLHLTIVSRSTSQMCDTVISSRYNGTIESPGFPNEYYGDQNCSYTFYSWSPYSTWQINFTYFHLPNTSCDSDYIQVYNNSQYQRYCYNSTPPPDLRDIYTLRFVSSVNASAGFGFQARVSEILKCGSTDIRLQENSPFQMKYYHSEPVDGRCEWTLTADQGLSIVMIGYTDSNTYQYINPKFKMYRGTTKDNSSLITVKYRYGDIAIDEASNIILIEYISKGTSYFYVSATFMAYNHTQNSTCGSATYNTYEEGYINLYSNEFSSNKEYHRNGICAWTIEAQEGEVIQLVVTRFYIQRETPGCNDSSRSYLGIYDGSQTEDSLLVRACSFDPLVTVTSKTRRLVVVLTIDEEFGFTQASFTAHYKSVNSSAIRRDCGGDISGDEGVVSSPNYPANYDNLRVCEWRITVEDSFNIRIDIHDLDIRPLNYGFGCAGDSLGFPGAYSVGYTGSYYRECGTYNGYYGRPPIYSTNNSLTMRFVSDWENTGRGFNVSWRKACNMILQTSNGWIQSPRFPTGYPNNLNCSYVIQAPNNRPGYFTTFTFNSFDLQEPDSTGSCIYDYLEVKQVAQDPFYKAEDIIPPDAREFCGKGPTQSLTTYFPTTLHFVTDGSITKGGFNISFIQTMAGCGASLYMGEKGFVTSPNYPGTFPRLINCTTTIRVEPGHSITLSFQSFVLGYYPENVTGSKCWWGSGGVLEVYDRISSRSVLIGKYCGKISPLPITSTSNELTLVFTSNISHYATGFNATYVSTLALTECPDNTYGTNCTNECTCNRQNTQSCNKTTGVCTCKGGWTGSTCDTDVDECTAGSVTCPGNSVCINLPGTYLCSCYSGFFKSNQTCLECAEGFYGASCTSACSCSVNTVSCNKTTGSCTCKAGWTGTRCDTDVNECALGVNSCTGSHVVCVNVDGGYRCDCSSGYTYNTSASTCSDTDECSNNLDDCLQVCTNTDGSYTCSCASDYWGTGNDCTELTKVPATLVVDIPIPASELANPYSVKYEGWKQMTAGAVFKRLTSLVPGLKEVHILRLSAGSLIVECQFVLDDHTYLTAVSDLISSLADLAFTSITIGNYSGNVVITVKGTSASSSSLCTVYDLVSQCPSGEQCQVEDSKPVCKPSPKDDVALIVGLTVGLTLAFLLIVAVVIIYIKKKKTRKGTTRHNPKVYNKISILHFK
ncbi:cubilin-like [Pomacea canaliculata]|uniref:cubilin-like n=1 Tax=Pomacea canaliculata TaxID=400727 RepID=UPI000D731488|nr:cubilin-like [Pomacea canaliculata]